MRTKTLLLAAAIIVAGFVSSQAATVYSQNIVGYVNMPLVPGYARLQTTLDLSGGNSLTNIFQNVGGQYDGTTVYVWNGTGYSIYTIDSAQPTGVGDAQDINPVPSPTINPGQLFYFNNNTAGAFTNTLVGTVHIEGTTSTNVVGITTNSLPPGYTFVASKIPVAGGISSVLGLSNAGGALDGTTVYIPNIVSGSFLGYLIVTFDSGQPTGFGDAQDINPVAEPVIPVGGGFIFNNNTATTFKWIQSF